MWLYALWFAMVFVLVLAPLSYGWGYRGWGPPRPPLARRRASAQAGAGAWGALADVVWLGVLVAVVWLIAALLL